MLAKYIQQKLSFCFYFFFIVFLHAQQTQMDVGLVSDFNKAVKLFNNKAYAAAQQSFIRVSKDQNSTFNLKADADYYDAMCAIRLNQTDADNKVLDFTENHPTSNKKDKALLNVGNYYFDNKKAAYALKWYQRVNADGLNEDLRKELNFKMAYALLAARNLTQAKSKFASLVNDPKFGNDSRYYYGYISYKQEDYEVAESTLSGLTKNETYKSEVTYYLLDISFRKGDFEKCVKVGLKLLNKSKVKAKDRSEISKIIGESYFNLGKYKESIPYLEAYKGKKGKWNNTDYYQVGYAYFKQKDYKNAVRYFNRILELKNNVSQNAYYNLGECYLYLDKKSEALNAFKSASEMKFDLRVKEDAYLNYAKLSYEEGNPYKSVAEVLQDYLKAYPKSKSYDEINSLVVTSYLHQEDFKGALTYLSKNNSRQNSLLAREVSYYRAIQLFNQNKLQESLTFFEEGKKASKTDIKAQSEYWSAEANYQLGNFQDALKGFKKFSKTGFQGSELNNIQYNIGYANFKLKDYKNAAIAFQQYLRTATTDDIEMVDDATIRMGDSFYANRDFSNAIKAYKKVADNFGIGADYAQFQAAMSYGLVKENENKIQALKDLVASFELSSYKDDALFQLGNTYALLKRNDEAHKAYQQLLKNHTKSFYNPNALLRNGLLYYNDDENQKALQNFKEIVAKFPNSEEAKQAVKNARNVYVDLGSIDAYATWVKTISFANVTDADLDNSMYESAENKFIENNTEKAIEGFQKYLKIFPQGLHALKSNFYLAQLYVKNNQPDLAIPNYQMVIAQDQSEFSEESLNKLSTIYLDKEDWQNAIPILERLETEANFPQNKLFAQSNLMKGYYQANNFEDALNYAEKVLLTDKIDSQVEYDAKIIIARCAFKQKDIRKAKEFYTEVERNATGELKAEALYHKALFESQDKKYEASNKVIQQITSNYSAYKYWGAKSFVIMAKNYYALENNDPYQATYILENIIKNFSQFTDVVSEAKTELTRIKTNEAKTNTSVNPKN